MLGRYYPSGHPRKAALAASHGRPEEDSMTKIHWLEKPEEHDYPAAEEYLTLHYDPEKAHRMVRNLRNSEVVSFHAKDIFRASGLPLLDASNHHVQHNRDKINRGEALSPMLLVRREHGNPVIVADGYHRLCAVYPHDEDARIPCQITD